jgi:long-subunit fatty acid transport protein
MRNFLLLATLTLLIPFQTFASGLDLNFLYGMRYVALGGHHVALGGDAYGPFYNPAQMISVDRTQFAFSSLGLLFQYDAPIGADNQQRKSENQLAPFFYLGGVHPLSERIRFGWAVYPTAAQGGKFKDVDYGSMTGLEYSNRLVRIEAAPSLAVRLMEHLSVGASWKLAYTQFDKKVGTFQSQLGASYLDSSLNTWDVKNFKFGVYVDNIPGLTIGATYRLPNSITLDGNGNLRFEDPNGAAFLGLQQQADYRTEQDITIPGQLQLGFVYEWIPERFLTAFTYEYTQNSVLDADEPRVGFIAPALTKTPLNWKDGHTYHGGMEYTFHLARADKLRTGVGIVFDRAITRNSEPNPVLAPSNHYIGYTMGAQYDWDRHVLGAAFAFGSYSDTTTTAELNSDLTGKVFAGKYGLNTLTFGVDYQFRY